MSQNKSLEDQDMISRADTVVATNLDDEVIMMSVESGKYFHLDDIATDVWSKLEEPASFGDVVAHLCEIYDVKLDQCRAQTADLIQQLADLNVLQVARA